MSRQNKHVSRNPVAEPLRRDRRRTTGVSFTDIKTPWDILFRNKLPRSQRPRTSLDRPNTCPGQEQRSTCEWWILVRAKCVFCAMCKTQPNCDIAQRGVLHPNTVAVMQRHRMVLPNSNVQPCCPADNTRNGTGRPNELNCKSAFRRAPQEAIKLIHAAKRKCVR